MKTFVTVMGKIAARLVFHRIIRSGPGVISMVMTMKMMIMATLLMMPAMAMLALAMIMRPRPLGPLEELPVGPRSARGWVCRNYGMRRATAATGAFCRAPHGAA